MIWTKDEDGNSIRFRPMCSVEGCYRPHLANGCCSRHRWLLRAHGRPDDVVEKDCRSCGEPFSYPVEPGVGRYLCDVCKPIRRQQVVTDSYRRKNYKRYGLTAEQVNALFESQGWVCAICGAAETYTRSGKVRLLCIDHDHATGKVRGALCGNCNSGLGHFIDSPELMEKAAEYIRRYQSC